MISFTTKVKTLLFAPLLALSLTGVGLSQCLCDDSEPSFNLSIESDSENLVRDETRLSVTGGEGSGEVGTPVKVTMKRGDSATRSLTITAEWTGNDCAGVDIVLVVPCGVATKFEFDDDFVTGNREISFWLVEPGPDYSDSISGEVRFAGSNLGPQRGSEAPMANSNNPGASGNPGGSPGGAVFVPSDTGPILGDKPAVVSSIIPLGYVEQTDGTHQDAGYVAFSHRMEVDSLNVASFEIRSGFFNPLDWTNAANKVRWASTDVDANPRIAIAEEAVARISNTTTGALVEVFPRASYNVSTQAFSGSPISRYGFDLDGTKVVVTEWLDGAASPTSEQEYVVDGDDFSESGGDQKVKVTEIRNLSLDDDAAIRASSRTSIRSVYQVKSTGDVLTSMTVEEYAYIPMWEVTGVAVGGAPIFGDLLQVREVLVSRRQDMDGDEDADEDTGDPVETWTYYGQGKDVALDAEDYLDAEHYVLLGKPKLEVNSTGNWTLYGYDTTGRIVVTFSPWLDTPVPDIGITDIVHALTDAGNSGAIEETDRHQVKKTITSRLVASETLTVTETTSLVDAAGVSKVIGVRVINPGGSSGPVDQAKTTTDEFSGSWSGGANAWTNFNFSPGTVTHTMTVRTAGTTVDTDYDFKGDIFVLPEHSTQEIVISDGNGPILRETRVLPTTGTGGITEAHFVPMTRETYSYDSKGREIQVKRDGRVISSTSYSSARQTVTTDEQGIVTTTTVDGQGRVVNQSTGAGGGVDAIVRTVEYDGLETRQRMNGVLVSRTKVDLAGRVIEQEDQAGIVTFTAYSADGLTETQILPGDTLGSPVTIVTSSHRDGRTASVQGTAVVNRHYGYDIEDSGNGTHFNQTTTERLHAIDSPRKKTSVYHWADGRLVKRLVPNAATETGAPAVVTTPGHSGLPNVQGYQYQSVGVAGGYSGMGSASSASFPANNAAGSMGMHTLSGAVEGWGTTSYADSSRLTRSERFYVLDGGYWWEKSVQTTGLEEAHATRQGYSMTRQWTGDGLKNISVSAEGEVVTTTTVFNIANQEATTTAVSNRSLNPMISHSVNGYVQWVQDRNSASAEHRASFRYDGFGRQIFARDPRGGTTQTIYNAAGQVEATIDSLGRGTTYYYLPSYHVGAGQVYYISGPQGQISRSYTLRGELSYEESSNEPTKTYLYNVYGDRTVLITGAWYETDRPHTLWKYNAAGLVEAKYYGQTSDAIPSTVPSGTVSYVYDPFGRLVEQSVVGGKSTKYGLNIFGEVTSIDYGGNGDAEVALTRDAAGLVATVSENFESAAGNVSMGSGGTAYTYIAGRLDKVEYSSGHTYLPNVKLDYKALDGAGRSSGYVASDAATPRLDVGYAYDTAGRLATVSADHGTFTYGYHPGSGIVEGYSGNSGGAVISQRRLVDLQNRIAAVVTKNGTGQTLASVAYSYDAEDHRTQARREDGGYWNYFYQSGQVTHGTRHEAGGAEIGALRRSYTYDGMGNRTAATFGATDRTIGYESNSFNQYTKIENPGYAWVVGQAPALDSVYVNGAVAGRQNNWFSKELVVTNTSGPVRQSVLVEDALGTDIATGHIAVPDDVLNLQVDPPSGSAGYDHAGNLVNDGKWDYEWDSMNRLRKMTPTATAVIAGFPNRVIEFVYDWQGRRIAKKVTQSSTVVSDRRYLYEGWNVVAEWSVTGSGLPVPQTYLWGLDLGGQQSGDVSQLQAAGGVGGLLAVDVIRPSDGATKGKLYAAYDGNGNILGWSGADGLVKQTQEYDPFGNVLLKKSFAANPLASGEGEVGYGFSTKPEDKETGLFYYGYRYYDPVTGRWPSRDPIQEDGGENLYGFIDNQPINKFDYLGRYPKFTDRTFFGKPVGKGGEVEFRAKTLSKTRQLPCASGSLQVVWDYVESFGILSGMLGDNMGTLNHEMHHYEGFENPWNDYLKRATARYFNRCMCANAAKCYNEITPLFGALVYNQGKLTSEALHLYGGQRNGNAISAYSEADKSINNTYNKYDRALRVRDNLVKEIMEKLDKCQKLEN